MGALAFGQFGGNFDDEVGIQCRAAQAVEQGGGQFARARAEFADAAGGLRQQFADLAGKGLAEQGGEGRGGNEVARRADFVRAAGVVAVLRRVEGEFHKAGKGDGRG